MSKSELENDQILLSRNDIRPQINYQIIALLPLMTTLIFYQTLIWSYTFSDDEEDQDTYQQVWLNFIQHQRKGIRENPITIDNQSRWQSVQSFIELIGIETMTALSHDYETASRLNEVLRATFNKLDEALVSGLTLLEALCQFTDDQSVRILTSHKSKGLEFDTVVLLGIENESYFGNREESLCTFFVGVSRAKRKLLLTYANERTRPVGFTGKWYEQRTIVEKYAGYVRPS